jgi:adenylosuccinate synthase
VPISIVIGGQFGSEGKGKVAHFIAKKMGATAVVRVGGPNSGHTVFSDRGEKYIFQHLPTAAILPGVTCVLGVGSYIDVARLAHEVQLCHLDAKRLLVDPDAVVICERDRTEEHLIGLRAGIGSTLTGTGAAVLSRISRTRPITFAKEVRELRPYLAETADYLSNLVDQGKRVVIEGTQGFGLSVLHTPYYPFATSRDTTAAAFLSEVGLSPLDVDDIVLTLRAFPIRVPGNSGPLPNETNWEEVTSSSGSSVRLEELTSVTRGLRRIANFDPAVVKAAIRSNRPTRIVLNHLDYFDKKAGDKGIVSPAIASALQAIESSIGARIAFLGMSPTVLLPDARPERQVA